VARLSGLDLLNLALALLLVLAVTYHLAGRSRSAQSLAVVPELSAPVVHAPPAMSAKRRRAQEAARVNEPPAWLSAPPGPVIMGPDGVPLQD
jgi:hypothetical protein